MTVFPWGVLRGACAEEAGCDPRAKSVRFSDVEVQARGPGVCERAVERVDPVWREARTLPGTG